MEFVQFADLKPTWDIVKFDEGIEDIPCISKNGYRKQNPLDKNIALLFEPERRVNVYYLPKTGEVIVTERNLYGETELTEAFGTKVSDYYKAKEKQRAVRSFLYEMVIGEYLVYRCFEMTAECKKHNENEYSCTISSVSEKKRYVFHNGGVFIENRDYTRIVPRLTGFHMTKCMIPFKMLMVHSHFHFIKHLYMRLRYLIRQR